jgi:uncharacterized protein
MTDNRVDISFQAVDNPLEARRSGRPKLPLWQAMRHREHVVVLGERGKVNVRVGKHRGRRGGTPPSAVLADIVRRIVEVARPRQIVLFGSAARGAMGPDSDVDLLVVKSGRFHRGRLIEAIYRKLRGAGAPVDVIVVTPEELERYRDDPCLIVAPALREGKLVYGA